MKLELAIALAVLSAGPAWAQSGAVTSTAAVVASGPRWTADLGGGAISAPRFPGAGGNRVLAVPYVEVRSERFFFAPLRDGIGFKAIRRGGLEAGPVVDINFGRQRENARAALEGLEDVDPTLEAGGFVRYSFGRAGVLNLEARRGLGGHDGAVVDASLNINAPPFAGQRLFLSAGPRATYYGERYAQSFFGVSQAESQRSQYAVFQLRDGFEVGVSAAAAYRLSERTTMAAFSDYGRLTGDVADSTIVRGPHGSRDQVTLGLAVVRRYSR